jgi:hypothetical protein
VKRKVVKVAKRNVAHADLMIAFKKTQQDAATSKEDKGKIGLKIAQLEDSRDEEVKFINHINNL